MDRHLQRWVSQLANIIVLMTTFIGSDVSRAVCIDFAERLEELAQNVRSRAPEK